MDSYDYSFVVNHPDNSVNIFPVTFNKSFRSKSIKITPNLIKKVIKVTYPFYVTKNTAIKFLEENKSWVTAQLELLPSRVIIEDESIITFIGNEYKIRHIPTARRGVWIEKNYIFVSGEKQFLNRRVKDFLKTEFKKYLNQRVKYYADKIDKKVSKISLKDTTTRWGSCVSNGNVAFSWRLCFAPVNIIDYVVAHEVAHLQELNHSNNFWKLVYKICDYNVDEAVKWLAREGLKLYSIE